MRSVRLAAALALTSLSLPAAAQEVSSAAGEIAGLEDALSRDEQALSGGDCSIACPALGSMDRSARRLCELDPGERCVRARARLGAAAERVRTQCPDCEVAQKKRDEKNAEVTVSGGSEHADPDSPAAAPPSEDASRAGCAGCVVGGQGTRAPWLAVALGLLLAIAARRRSRRSR